METSEIKDLLTRIIILSSQEPFDGCDEDKLTTNEIVDLFENYYTNINIDPANMDRAKMFRKFLNGKQPLSVPDDVFSNLNRHVHKQIVSESVKHDVSLGAIAREIIFVTPSDVRTLDDAINYAIDAVMKAGRFDIIDSEKDVHILPITRYSAIKIVSYMQGFITAAMVVDTLKKNRREDHEIN